MRSVRDGALKGPVVCSIWKRVDCSSKALGEREECYWIWHVRRQHWRVHLARAQGRLPCSLPCNGR